MNLVIDAQVIAGLYCETVLGQPHNCTAPPSAVANRLGVDDVAFLDESDQIENEWRRVAGSEWFDAWLGDRLAADEVRYTEAASCQALINRLRTKCGFPAKGRDSWYIRTARALRDKHDEDSVLITEDLDFFQPNAKGGAGNRDKILAAGKGPVQKELSKEGVLVRPVHLHP